MANITVIVPVYKVEDFLSRCVDSILCQSYTDFELVLVDDGSPDHCGEICDSYAQRDKRVHVIHQENGGLSAARNSGIDWAFENSQSHWLAFVDSDDWVHPDFLKVLYEAAEETLCKLSVCDFFRTSGKDFSEQPFRSVMRIAACDFYCGDYQDGHTEVAWNKLYHKSLLKDLRYPVGRIHEDQFTTYLTVFQAGSVAVTPMVLYAYYQNPDGITKAPWSPRRMDVLEAFRQQIQFARDHQGEQFLKKAAEQYLFSSYEQLGDAPVVFAKELRKMLREAMKICRECGAYPVNWSNRWFFEAAYPCKPFWWLISRFDRGAKERK